MEKIGRHGEQVTQESADVLSERIDGLVQLFPEVFTEGKIECGKRHFRDALEVDFKVATSVKDLPGV